MGRPRIRSLKPEALQHRKIGRLSDGAFRLWTGLVTQADDEGRVRWYSDSFRVVAWSYHPTVTDEMVVKLLKEIVSAGLAVPYKVNGIEYLELHDWKEHQKISHPLPSQHPERSQADPGVLQSPPEPPGAVTSAPASRAPADLDLDRIGSGSVLPAGAPPVPPPAPPVEAPPKKPLKKSETAVEPDKSKGALAFEAYATAYQARYGVAPVRNSQVNSIFKQLAQLLGGEAPAVAAFFVGRQDQFYVRDKHSPGPLRRDYMKIRTEWATRDRRIPGVAAEPQKPVSTINPGLTGWVDEPRRAEPREAAAS